MKKSILILLVSVLTLSLHAQKDSTLVVSSRLQESIKENSNIIVSIYPVPVRENRFTVKTNRDVSFIRITNIIGQDIFRNQYNTPQQLNRITLDNPKRGIYLVSIIFSDGTRVVKKIMIEESE